MGDRCHCRSVRVRRELRLWAAAAGVCVLQLIAAAVEVHSAVEVAVVLKKMMMEMAAEDDEGQRAFGSICVDFESRSVLCHQAMDPFGRTSQSVILILGNRPIVRFARHHMWEDFNKTPSFVDLEMAQEVRVARGKRKQPNSQSCYPLRILPPQTRCLIFPTAPNSFPPNRRPFVQRRCRLPRPNVAQGAVEPNNASDHLLHQKEFFLKDRRNQMKIMVIVVVVIIVFGGVIGAVLAGAVRAPAPNARTFYYPC